MKKLISLVDNIVFKFWIVFMVSIFGISIFVKSMYNMDDSPYFECTTGLDIVCIVIAILVYIGIFRLHDWIEKNVPYLLLIILFSVVSIAFVTMLPIYPISDPASVTDGALMFAKGDINGIMESEYLQCVIKNMKVSMFYALFLLPLPKTIISLRLINVLFYIIIAVCTGKICKNIFNDYEKTGFIIAATYLPFILYTNQVYFDLPVLCLGTIAFYFYTKEKTMKNFILALVFSSIATFLRILGGIFIVAIIIDFLFNNFKNESYIKKKKLIFEIFIIIILGILISICINAIIGHFFKNSEIESESIWALFCMGLNEPEFGMMHNEYLNQEGYRTFEDFKALLFDRSLLTNIKIFGKKIFWLWTQGTYQAQRYGFGYNMTDPSEKFMHQTVLTNHFMSTDFILPTIVIQIMRSQYMALFVLMIVGICRVVKNKLYDIYRLFTYLFFGTFLILIIYEMKSRYVLHLSVCMIIFAICGLQGINKIFSRELTIGNIVDDYRWIWKKIIPIVVIVLLIVGTVSGYVWKVDKDEADRQAKIQEEKDARWKAATDLCNEYNLKMTTKTITIDGVSDTYNFMYVSDTHAVIPTMDELPAWNATTDSRLEMFKNPDGMLSTDQFSHWIDVSNELCVKGVLLGGDMIDYASDENVQWLSEQLDRLNMPYVYALGNHDSFDVINNTQNPDNEKVKSLFTNDDDQCSYVDYGEFIVCAINSGLRTVPEEALEKFRKVYSMGKPIILLSHVPLYSDANESLKVDTETIRGEDRLIGPNLDYKLDSTTQEFYDMVGAENSPVVAVLCGHVHFNHDDMLWNRIPQYTIGCASGGEAYYIEVKGK